MKKLKQIVHASASLVLVFSAFSPLLVNIGKAYASSGGEGTANSPYRIANCADLEGINPSTSSGVYYALTQSFDCSSVNSGSGFVPIGNYDFNNVFSGTLDGRNFTVSGITINADGNNDVGLFTHTRGATIENLKLSGLTINDGDQGLGSLAGSLEDTNLSHVSSNNYTINQVGSSAFDAGGIAGQFTGSETNPTASSVWANGTINSSTTLAGVGGLFGEFDSSSLSDSYANLTFSDTLASRTGGLIGYVYQSNLTDNYTTGSISVHQEGGGLAGDAYTSSTFTNNFSVTSVTVAATDGGGFIGYVDSSIDPSGIVNNYWDEHASTQTQCDSSNITSGCTPIDSDGTDLSHYKNTQVAPLDQWDFDTIWTKTVNYPTLQDASLSTIQILGTPSAPTNLVATNTGANVVHLSWDAPTDDGGSTITYNVQYKLSSDSSWTDWNSLTDTDDDVTGLTGGNSYDFQVIVSNFSGDSDPSATTTFLLQVDQATPIASCEDLENINNDLSGDYELTQNIDCSDSTSMNEGAGFMPIGFSPDGSNGFSGIFNGNGHTISNLYINAPDTDFMGLFSTLEGAQVSNLHITGQVTGGLTVGGLAGAAVFGTQISNVSVNMTVRGVATSDDSVEMLAGVGGLLGFSGLSTIISQSVSSGTLHDTTTDGALVAGGGLVGQLAGGEIVDSYSTMSVVGDPQADGQIANGGLVGFMLDEDDSDEPGVVTSYATGAVSVGDDQLAGGLVGVAEGGAVVDSFSAGAVSGGDEATLGGLIGGNEAETLDGNYYDQARSGVDGCTSDGDSADCSPVNTSDDPDTTYFFNSSSNAPLLNWDFDTVWQTTSGYPTLRNTPTGAQTIDISSCEGLEDMSNDLTAQYVLTADIDCSDTPNWNNGWGFEPVGFESEGGFTGTFDGQGHTISHLYINAPGTLDIGLFSVLTGAQVSNVNITGQFSGATAVGGLAGEATAGSQISMVSVDATVRGEGNDNNFGGEVIGVGGLLGYMDEGVSVARSFTTGSLTDDVVNGGFIASGGLVGQMFGGTITDTYSRMSVTGGDVDGGGLTNGGLVGYSIVQDQDDVPTVARSYSTGTVTGGAGSDVGGLIGIMGVGNILDSFSTGQVVLTDTTNSVIGGLVTYHDEDTMTDNFFDVTRSGLAACSIDGVDGTSGCTAVNTVDSPDATYFFNNTTNGPFSTWDFDSVWQMNADDYPTLQGVGEISQADGSGDSSGSGSSSSGAAGPASSTTVLTKPSKAISKTGASVDNSVITPTVTLLTTPTSQQTVTAPTTTASPSLTPHDENSGTTKTAAAISTLVILLLLAGLYRRHKIQVKP